MSRKRSLWSRTPSRRRGSFWGKPRSKPRPKQRQPFFKPKPKQKPYTHRYIVEATNDMGKTRKIKTFRNPKNPGLAKEEARNFIKDRKYNKPGMEYKIRTDKVKRGWL